MGVAFILEWQQLFMTLLAYGTTDAVDPERDVVDTGCRGVSRLCTPL
jgi:hypothetical protein